MAATIEELKELSILAREAGDLDLEEKALTQLIALQEQATPQTSTAPVPTGRGIAGQRREREREQALSQLAPERRALLESISPTEAALIGAGAGFMDIGRGIGLVDPADTSEQEAMRQLEESAPLAAPLGRAAAQSAPFMVPGMGVAGIASTPIRAAATVGLGAAEGGIIAKGRGEDIGTQILSAGIGGTIAGAFELGVPVIGRIGGKLIRRVTGKTPKGAVIDAAGNPSDELLAALDAEELSFDDLIKEATIELKDQVVNPEQAARKAFLESQGIEPTQAQVSRLASDFMEQQELAKRSSKVRDALQRQNAALTTRFNNAVLETGGTPSTPTNTVIDTVTERATVLDQEIDRLYKLARENAGVEKNVKFTSLKKALNRLAPQNRKGGYNIESVTGELKEKGILDSKGNLIGKIDVNTAEDVRQSINALYDPANGFGNTQLRMLKESLDEDVFRSSGKDVFEQARKARFKFDDDLKRAKISKFDKRNRNLVRDILENKVNPDSFTNDVVFSKSWRAEDLSQLKNYLQADDAGKEAFNNLRADVMEEIRIRSFTGELDENGLQNITRAKLESALNRLGDDKRKILFTSEENKFLDNMLKVTKLRAPVPGTALGEGPSAAAINRFRQAFDKLGLFSDIIEGISVSNRGNVVIKAKPVKTVRPISGSQFRQAAGLGTAALTTQAVAEEE